MATIRIKKSQLQSYLNQNPDKQVKVYDQTGNVIHENVKKPGLLEGILTGMLSPVENLLTDTADIQNFDIYKSQSGQNLKDAMQNFDPSYMENERFQDRFGNPLKTGLTGVKDIAGIASYAVPGGGGTLTQAAGRGALAGGTYGLGTSEYGKELESTLKGGAGGAATGAALFGLSKALSKGKPITATDIAKKTSNKYAQTSDDVFNARLNEISNTMSGKQQSKALDELLQAMPTDHPLRGAVEDVASTIQPVKRGFLNKPLPEEGAPTTFGDKLTESGTRKIQKALGIKTPQAAKGYQQGIQQTDEFINIVKAKGQPLTQKGMGKAAEQYSDEISTLLKGSTSTVDKGAIKQQIVDDLASKFNNIDDVSNIYQNNALKYLGSGDTPLTGQGLADAKRSLQDIVLKIADKEKAGGTLTPKDEVLKSIYNAVDSNLKNNIPEIRAPYKSLAIMESVAPDIIKRADKTGYISSPLVASGIKVPTFGVGTRANIAIGNLERNIGSKGLSLPGIDLSNINVPGMNAIQNVAPLAASSALNFNTNNMNTMNRQPQQSGASPQLTSLMGSMQYGNQAQNPLSGLAEAQQAAMQLGFDPTDINVVTKIAAQMAPQSTETAASQDKSKLANAIDQMELLYGAGTDQSLSAGGTTTGPVGLLKDLNQRVKGQFNQDFQDRKVAYDQMKALALGLLNQARGAGTLNEGEYQVMTQNVPNEFSSEGQAQQWFQNVRAMLLNGGGGGFTQQPTMEDFQAYLAQN